MSVSGWSAVLCVVLAVLVGGRPRRHPGLSRLAAPVGQRIPARAARVSGREAARRRAAVVLLAESLAGELQAGAEPRAALAAAARASPLLADVAAAARAPSADVAAALRRLGDRGGGDAARDLALLWSVGEVSGAGLAAPARRLAAGLRDDEQVRREVAAQLAGPRATAWLLAGLPVFGLAMGSALGARPWALFTTPLGLLLVGPGATLEIAGLLWTRAITRRVLPD